MTSGKDSGRGGIGRLLRAGPSPKGRRRGVASFLWFLLLAMSLRGIAAVRIDPVAFDSAVYFEMADLIRADRWSEALAYAYPPLFPALIASVQRVGVSAETAGLVIALAADLLVLIPLVAIGRTAAGEAAAWGAAFLWAIHPYAIHLGVQALADAPTAIFVALALWAGLRALDEGRLLWALGAGVASGLAYLLRPEGIEPALALAALYIRQGNPATGHNSGASAPASARGPGGWALGRSAMRRVAWAMAPLVGWVIVASPYIVYISVEAGSITLSKKKSTSAMFHSLTSLQHTQGQRSREETAVPRTSSPLAAVGTQTRSEERRAKGDMATEATSTGGAPNIMAPQGSPVLQPSEKASDHSSKVAGARRQSWLRWMARSTYIFQKPLVNGIGPVILFFGFLALWSHRSQRAEGSSTARALLIGLLGLHLAILLGLAADHGATYLGGHHFFLMVLYALPFAGAGLASTLTWGTGRLRAPRWLAVVTLACFVAVTIGWVVTRRPGRGVAVRPAAAWIRTQAAGTPVVMTNITKLTYHAGAERVEPDGPYDDVLRNARARSAQFLVFYPDLMPHDFLARLHSADLELVKTFPEPSPSAPDQRLEVYRLLPRPEPQPPLPPPPSGR